MVIAALAVQHEGDARTCAFVDCAAQADDERPCEAMWEGSGSKPDWSKTGVAYSFSPKRSNPVPGPAFAENRNEVYR
jgi:hypothetical protein